MSYYKSRTGRFVRTLPTTRRCGKLHFTTRDAALAAAEGQTQWHGVTYRVYHCTKCLGFHLTTKR